MAFEAFNSAHNQAKMAYWGFDMNERWRPIHNKIVEYCDTVGINTKFEYEDAIEYIRKNKIPKANVLILQYVVSHFISTNQYDQLNDFFEDLEKHVVPYMEKDAVIIIQDANHPQLGRDDFIKLPKIIFNKGQMFRHYKRYFDSHIKRDEQRYGKSYPSTKFIFNPSRRLQDEYYSPRECCGGVQLLLKLECKP